MGWYRKATQGFTLIETLVAFIILAFSLAAVFSVFSGSVRAVATGADYAHAVALAEATLASVDSTGLVQPANDAGEDGKGYRWEVEVGPWQGLSPGTGESGLVPVRVVVTVTWGAGNGRSVSLTTMRISRS